MSFSSCFLHWWSCRRPSEFSGAIVPAGNGARCWMLTRTKRLPAPGPCSARAAFVLSLPQVNRRLRQGGMFMLVLTRKIGERVMVPESDLQVTVVAIEGNTV